VIGLDTNVLVRFLVEDDDEQTLKATQLIEGAVRAGVPLYVSAVVLCEVIWVLARIYRLTKDELVEIVRSLVQTPELEIEGRDGVRRALEAFVSGKGDFSDDLIRRWPSARDATASPRSTQPCSRSRRFFARSRRGRPPRDAKVRSLTLSLTRPVRVPMVKASGSADIVFENLGAFWFRRG